MTRRPRTGFLIDRETCSRTIVRRSSLILYHPKPHTKTSFSAPVVTMVLKDSSQGRLGKGTPGRLGGFLVTSSGPLDHPWTVNKTQVKTQVNGSDVGSL